MPMGWKIPGQHVILNRLGGKIKKSVCHRGTNQYPVCTDSHHPYEQGADTYGSGIDFFRTEPVNQPAADILSDGTGQQRKCRNRPPPGSACQQTETTGEPAPPYKPAERS